MILCLCATLFCICVIIFLQVLVIMYTNSKYDPTRKQAVATVSDAGEFMPWLIFTWTSSVWRLVIMKYQLVHAHLESLTETKTRSNAFCSCFWRTSLPYPT